MNTTIEKHLDVTQPNLSAVDFLADNTSLSKQKIKDAMKKGCVWHTLGKNTRRLRRAKKIISQGSQIHIYYNEKILNTKVIEPQLIADEEHYSIWSKPSGMLSQGSKWGDHCTLLRWSDQNLKPQRNSFLVHRLDRAASGLIMIAHSKHAASQLSGLFQNREISKQYTALVEGIWQHDKRQTIEIPIENKAAVSHVDAIEIDQNSQNSRLRINIETGRKHQIRRHLSESGYPIVGDRQYGAEDCTVDLRLCAVKLEFQCPITNQPKSYQNKPIW